MLQTELDKIDIQVQTSLEYLQPSSREELTGELRKLREDKSLLEGKIRGYLTLSDICREYKEELQKLRLEYNKLLQKVNSQTDQEMGLKNHTTGSPTSETDPGPSGHDSEQRTEHLYNNPHHHFESPNEKAKSFLSALAERDTVPVRTKELFDQVEDPKKSSEGHKSMPHSIESQYHDKYPMQESMAEDLEKSATGLGFERITPGSSFTQATGQTHSGDLMNFSYPTGRPPPKSKGQDLEDILKSVSDSPKDLSRVIAEVKAYAKQQQWEANQVLVDQTSELKTKLHDLEDDNKRLIKKIKLLEKQIFELSLSRSASPEAQGWVQVEKPTKTGSQRADDVKQKSTLSSDELEILKQRNLQLTEANQRWSNEWNKLQEHYETRISDLQVERDQIAKEMTELRITEESKQRDFEKMLMTSKKKASDEENAKEEAFFQLTSLNNRVEDLRQQLQESQDQVAVLRREKQVLETERSVTRQTPLGAGTEAQAYGSRTSKSQAELKTENEVLRQQLLVFQEDFDRERQDRAKATSIKDEYKKQNEQLKKRVRHVEQKNVNLEKQIKTLDDNIKKLQSEKSALQQELTTVTSQLNREIAKNRTMLASQGPYQPPMIQSAGMRQPQQQMIFGQPIQPQPQQFVVQPPYEQFPYSPSAGGGVNYGQMPGIHHQLQHGGYPGFYQTRQTGKQTEYRPGAWSCGQCTYVNYPGRTVCEMCGYIQSNTNQTFNYRPTGNDTLHARGDPQQQGPYGNFAAGTAAHRDVTTEN